MFDQEKIECNKYNEITVIDPNHHFIMQSKWHSILLILFSASIIYGQNMSYTLFNGKVYKYPNARKYIKFEENYEDLYPLLNELSWDSIYVTQRDTDIGFPDVDRDGAFGIMFKTVLSVDETSMYRFAITSDDGSIVWVDGKKIIDNDYSNGMHMKADTIALRPGEHAVKIWYYQAYPTMLGLIYESEPVAGEVTFDIDTILLDQDLLFDINSFQIIKGNEYCLDSLSQLLLSYNRVIVNIIGYTDNIGTPESNLILSQRRAESIRDFLLSHVEHNGAKYITKGLGEEVPIADNDTSEGRANNRRVEILIEGY